MAATATVVDEEADEEPTATPESTEEATPVPSPEPESEGGLLDTVRTFVQENMLLAILIVAAVALLFLIVVIVVVILIRRRRMSEQEELPPIPEAPFAPQPFEALQPDTGAPADWPDRLSQLEGSFTREGQARDGHIASLPGEAVESDQLRPSTEPVSESAQ